MKSFFSGKQNNPGCSTLDDQDPIKQAKNVIKQSLFGTDTGWCGTLDQDPIKMAKDAVKDGIKDSIKKALGQTK